MGTGKDFIMPHVRMTHSKYKTPCVKFTFRYVFQLNYVIFDILKDPKWQYVKEKISTDAWSFLCPDQFAYFEGWCYSLRNASDFVEADCSSLNATMVNEPDYKVNYFIAGNQNCLL